MFGWTSRLPNPAWAEMLVWSVAVTLLALLLVPTGGLTVLVGLQTAQGRVGFVAAVAILVAARLMRLPRATVPSAGLAGALAALGGSLKASEWDLDGTLSDGTVTGSEQLVAALALGGGAFAFLLGLAVLVAARSWPGRAAGLGIAHVGAFAVAGFLFL